MGAEGRTPMAEYDWHIGGSIPRTIDAVKGLLKLTRCSLTRASVVRDNQLHDYAAKAVHSRVAFFVAHIGAASKKPKKVCCWL
jgi:hypothetical protein